MSVVGESRSLGILFYMPKIQEPTVKRSKFLLCHWNGKSKIDDPVIISSLVFTPQKKKCHLTHFAPPYSFCPTLP